MNLRISTELSLHLDSYAPLNPFIESGNYFYDCPKSSRQKVLTSRRSLDMRKLAVTREFASMIPHPTKEAVLLNRYHLG